MHAVNPYDKDRDIYYITSRDADNPTDELIKQVYQLKSFLEHKASKKFGKIKETARLRPKLEQFAEDFP